MNKTLRLSVPVILSILAFGASAPLAFAADPCTTGVGSPLLVNVTQHITNDVDSGNHGNWALDNYDRHIQVWLDNGNTYCAQVDYNGTFRAPAGVSSPEAGQPITQDIRGTMIGGYRASIVGTATSSPNIPTTVDYQGVVSTGAIPGYVSWLAATFNPGYVFHYLNNDTDWSWTYRTDGSNSESSWVNAGTGSSGDITPVFDATAGVGYFSIQAAIDAATSTNTIMLGADVTTGARINVNKAVTIDGNGHTLRPNFSKTGNDNAAIGIGHSDVTIKNLVIDGTSGTNLHGINVYTSTGVVLDTVTVSHSGHSGVVVNGSTVTATNLNTSANGWNGVNVDPGVGVTTQSVFTLNSGNLADSTQIWSDGGNVTSTTTVTVTVPTGYTKYAHPGYGPRAFFWSNKPIANGATITNGSGSTFYSTIQAAINAASTSTPDTINVGAGTYTEQLNITKPLALIGAGVGTTIINTPEPSTMVIYDAFGSKSPTIRYNGHRGADIPVVRIASSDVTFQGFDVNLGNKAFWNVKGSYGTNYSRSVGILVDHVETVPGTSDSFTNVRILNNKVEGMLAGDYGDSIKALGNATVTIQGNTIYAYGESGISAIGSEDFPSFPHPYHPTVTANSNTIYGNSAARPGTNYFFGIGYWIGATGSADGNTIYNAPNNNGNALNSWTTMPVSFTHNVITTDGGTVGGNGAQLYQSTALVFSNNTIANQGLVGITYLNPTVTISGNTITNSTDGFLIDQQTSGSVKINNNSISGIPAGHYAILVGGAAGTDSGTIFGAWDGPSNIAVDAANNWWGSPTGPTIASNPAGVGGALSTSTIAYAPWYIDSGRSALNTDISGAGVVISGSFVPSETTDGAVTLPTGTSDLSMDSGSVLDLSASANTEVGGNITIAGASIDLTHFTTIGGLTDVDLDRPQTVGSTTVTIAQAVQLSSGTSTEPIIITSTALPNVSASIPDGTTILAPAGWTGTIAPPTAATGSGDAPSGFSVGSSVIDVGSAGTVLLFDKPVTLTLAGVTGVIGYRPAGSTEWKKITEVCGGDYANPTFAADKFPGECAISNGTDTKILTYHFTSFGGMTPIAPTIDPNGGIVRGSADVTMSNPSGLPIHYTTDGSTPTCSSTLYGSTFSVRADTTVKAVSCDGSSPSAVTTSVFSSPSGGSGGGGGGGAVPATPATPAVPTVSPATPATPATPVAKGKVLGAAAYNFTKALTVGVRGDEVTELQKVLIAGGLLKVDAPTGYFGSLTRTAVIAFQKARGIAQVGTVGPLTRAELNKGTVETTSETATTTPEVAKGKTNLSASQVSSIIAVLESFGADASVVAKVKAALGQ